jgi:Putative zinc-finger
MRCREFRDRHSLFVDARCSAFDENAMRDHMAVCPQCARHDTLVRRSLMIVRNLPRIQPSPDFQARLDARLRAATHVPEPRVASRPSFVAFTAIAATLAFATVAATVTLRHSAPATIRMDPVVATLPELESAPSPVASPALVATVPTGMSVWPGIMVATQAPMHFVAAELASER